MLEESHDVEESQRAAVLRWNDRLQACSNTDEGSGKVFYWLSEIPDSWWGKGVAFREGWRWRELIGYGTVLVYYLGKALLDNSDLAETKDGCRRGNEEFQKG